MTERVAAEAAWDAIDVAEAALREVKGVPFGGPEGSWWWDNARKSALEYIATARRLRAAAQADTGYPTPHDRLSAFIEGTFLEPEERDELRAALEALSADTAQGGGLREAFDFLANHEALTGGRCSCDYVGEPGERWLTHVIRAALAAPSREAGLDADDEYHEHVAGDKHSHSFSGPHSHGGVSALSYPRDLAADLARWLQDTIESQPAITIRQGVEPQVAWRALADELLRRWRR